MRGHLAIGAVDIEGSNREPLEHPDPLDVIIYQTWSVLTHLVASGRPTLNRKKPNTSSLHAHTSNHFKGRQIGRKEGNRAGRPMWGLFRYHLSCEEIALVSSYKLRN